MTGCESPGGLCNSCAEAALVGGRVLGDFAFFFWSSPCQVWLPTALGDLVAAAPCAEKPDVVLRSSRCCCPSPLGVLHLQLGSSPAGVCSLSHLTAAFQSKMQNSRT